MNFEDGKYKPPFPWAGGKSRIADVIWSGLGDVKNYVEPFFGSGAVLFLRPGGAGPIETVNDFDGFVANFWRAMQHDSDAVAHHADNPVNECDLHARHLWLIGQRESITSNLCGDADFYDAKAAGWWAWGQSCWISGGWCSGKGPWVSKDGEMVLRGTAGQGVNRQLPHLGDAGQGVNRQLPHLGDAGQGVKRKRPHLGNAGQGVNRKRPHLSNAGQGVNRQRPHLSNAGQGVNRQLPHLSEYLRDLADRIRNVRVCCGDWSRVCTFSVTTKHGVTGVFLDPPYADTANRSSGLYACDSESVAHAVREWAIANGDNPLMRIVLAGYDGEHAMPESWRVHQWSASGGMANIGKKRLPAENRHKERLWFSPHCVPLHTKTAGQLEFAE